MIKFKSFQMDSVADIVNRRKIEKGGPVQKFIDSEVMRLMDPYTPFREGTLKGSPQRDSIIGSGRILQITDYARRLYYNPQYNFNEAPRRGGKWFERMKENHKDDILKGAAALAGAKTK